VRLSNGNGPSKALDDSGEDVPATHEVVQMEVFMNDDFSR
jgi:hypothetical protein